jgi:hypothetical protein
MVLGGGSVEINQEGTPQPGISGGEGEFSNFAPLNSSNIQFLGDIGPGESLLATQKIIVNVATTPGAYPLKFSFIYTTETGEKVIDNQVITLLVYQMPVIEVGFYQDPGMLFAQQPNPLPLQVVNLGKQTVVLGNMQVTAENASLENNLALVGPVEAGFYFTLDSLLIPNSAGPLDLTITINYTDDFNQPRVYETVLSLDIAEPMSQPEEIIDPNGEMPNGETPGMEMPFPDQDNPGAQDNFWQKLLRGIKGLLGLDSGPSDSGQDFFPEDMSNYEDVLSGPAVKGP